VANHPSSEKRNRQTEKRTLRNRAVKSAVRTHVKTVRAAIDAKDPAASAKALREASIAITQAAAKGSIPKKTASRKISRLAKAAHALTKKA
jgi:small subunit ribosomal protein S20